LETIKMRAKWCFFPILLVSFAGFCFSADYYCGSDGFADRVIVRDDGEGNALWIVDASTADAFGDGLGDLSGTFGLITDYHMLGDVNGDGYIDRVVARIHSSGNYLWWEVSYSGPRGFGTTGVNASNSFGGPDMIPYAVADVDGDGTDDCIAVVYDASESRNYYVKYSAGGFLAGTVETSYWGGTNTDLVDVCDVNNDGVADRVDYFTGAGWRVDFGAGQGGFGDSQTDWAEYFGGTTENITRHIGDVNNDGYGDRVLATLNQQGYYDWIASFSTPSGFGTEGPEYNQAAPFGQTGDQVILADVLTEEVPEALSYLAPYTDSFGTNGLWHCDEIIEAPDGELITPDDDSENPARNHDMVLRSGVDLATYATGPQLVTDKIGDPESGDPDFGNCFQFDGFSQSLWADTLLTDTLGVDDGNFKVEAWVKFEGETYSAGDEYFIVCNHQRYRIRFVDHATLGFFLSSWVFDANVTPHHLIYTLPTEDINQWNHVALTFYKGTASLYLNGDLVASKGGLTPTINPSTTERVCIGAAMFGGPPTNYFYGKIDEVRIGQAVPTPPQCGYWGYSPADLDKDCYVDINDLNIFVSQWLDCTIPGDESCIPW
jgi:hypothetical protein